MNFKPKQLTYLALGISLITGSQVASAFSSYTTNITNYCNEMGYDLTSDYQSDSCSACHSDDQAKNAYSSGDYEFFCPAPQPTVCTDNDEDGYFAEGEVCGTAADFDDNEPAAYPGATEICDDGIDNDGNGLVDSADSGAVGCEATCTDMDNDGYSIEGGSCGAVDCDDLNADVNPGAAEICTDAIDNNCNGLTDTADMNAVNCPLNCTDNDADGYSIEGGECGAIDCDDNNADVNPGALEVCDDGIDNNCDSHVDSADNVCQTTDDDDTTDENHWWRHKRRGHHSHDHSCDPVSDSDDSDNSSDDSYEYSDEDSDDRHSRRQRYSDYPFNDRHSRRYWYY
jgi:hypothetical protein